VRGAAARRRIVLGAAFVVAFGMAGLASPASADAAEARCNGRKMKTLNFAAGRVHVYKSNAVMCAVTVAKNPGTWREMSVSIQARGSRPRSDSGRYTRHAGPVRVTVGHRCVFIRGSVGKSSVSSGWTLC
jgi:hypothetical protein